MIFFNKRADLSAGFLISIIVAVVCFAVVAYFIYSMNVQELSEREACAKSVATRQAINNIAKEFPPLNCVTKEVCVVLRGEKSASCGKYFGDDYSVVEVDENDLDNELKKVLAREMADSWYVMGEGKEAVFTREFELTKKDLQCVVMTLIAFDDSVRERIKFISGVENYLIRYKVPGKEISYWDFLVGKNATYKDFSNTAGYYTNKSLGIYYSEIKDSKTQVQFTNFLVLGNPLNFVTASSKKLITGSFFAQPKGTSGIVLAPYPYEGDDKNFQCDSFKNLV